LKTIKFNKTECGVDFLINTGVRIDPKFYKAGTDKKPTDKSDVGKLISDSAPYASVIKTNLKQLALDVQTIANTAKANKIPVTKDYLRTQLDKIHKHKDEQREQVKTFQSISSTMVK